VYEVDKLWSTGVKVNVEYPARLSLMETVSEYTRFTPALLSSRFRQSVGTLVLRGKGGILSLIQDRSHERGKNRLERLGCRPRILLERL